MGTSLHCDGTWSGWNHTKAHCHLCGNGKDIKSCLSRIPDKYKDAYQGIWDSKNGEKKARAVCQEMLHG